LKLRFSYLLILFLMVNSWCSLTRAVDLPNIGDASGKYLSIEDEQRLGEAFMRNLRQTLTINDDPEVNEYIQSLGYRLVANSDAGGRKFTFFVVEDPVVNAFAGPGGYIGINTGLILLTDDEDELAAVMAHEISHVTQRHLARAFEASSKMSLPATAAIIAAIILGSKEGQLGEAALATTLAGSAQSQINFTFSNEEEADRIGMLTLAKSGLDPHSMPQFFERLQQSIRYTDDQTYEFLRTHPVTTARIADSENRAEQLPYTPKPDSGNYLLIKTKILVNEKNKTLNGADYFADLLKNPDPKKEYALHYGYALALLAENKYDKARKEITKLIKQDPERLAYQLVLAKIELADGNTKKALDIYADNFKLYPHNYPLTIQYTTALIQSGQPQLAARLLQEHLRLKSPTPKVYNLLAQAESDAGHPVEAHQALAEYNYLNGRTRIAIEQLKIALDNTAENDATRKARIQARLTQLQDEVKTEAKKPDKDG
jgi:beta-barrel assembly-enhancing protease